MCVCVYSKSLNNRTRGANNEYRGGPGGPGSGFGGPRGGLRSNVRSGKPLRLLLRKPPLGPPKPLPGPPGPPRGSFYGLSIMGCKLRMPQSDHRKLVKKRQTTVLQDV